MAKYNKTADYTAQAVKVLSERPEFRKRKNLNRAIATILRKRYPHYFQKTENGTFEIKPKDFVDLLKHAKSVSRGIRKAKEMFPMLDGDKGNDSKIYTTQTIMLELGYEPGYYQDIKKYL